jgi:hypothetical protein
MQSGLATAIERVRAGDAVAAWSAAESATDPLERAQARVYVRQHAGDLEWALQEAVEGSAAHPRDPWLAERALSIALSLSRPRPAQTAMVQLEKTLADTGVRDREAFLAALNSSRGEVAALESASRARDAAEKRAYAVVIGLGAVSLIVLFVLARRS